MCVIVGSDGLSGGETAGLVIGLLLVVVIVVAVVGVYKSKQPRGRKISPREATAMQTGQRSVPAENGVMCSLNV